MHPSSIAAQKHVILAAVAALWAETEWECAHELLVPKF